MNKIMQEKNESLKYNLKELEGGKLVALTMHNVALVEAMIRHDSDYSSLGGIDKNSSTYWFAELKKIPKNIMKSFPNAWSSLTKKIRHI